MTLTCSARTKAVNGPVNSDPANWRRNGLLTCAIALYLTQAGCAWHERATSGPPGGRAAHAMAFDPVRQQVMLFGGRTKDAIGTLISANDTWEWDATVGNWNLIASSGPVKRSFSAMVNVADANSVILFGGLDQQSAALSDLWKWDGNGWTQLPSTGDTPADVPKARYQHAMAYDPSTKKIVLFGGFATDAAVNYPLGDTYEWDVITQKWKRYTTSLENFPRAAHCMAYDPTIDRVVMFGGNTAAGGQACNIVNELWLWDSNGHTWQGAPAPGSGVAPPSPRATMAGAFNEYAKATMVVGGHSCASPRLVDNESYFWYGFLGGWGSGASGTRPSARDWTAMAYDLKRSRMVLFGGFDEKGNLLGDTWELSGPQPPNKTQGRVLIQQQKSVSKPPKHT